MSNENTLNALLQEDLSDVPTSQPQLKGPFEFEVLGAEMKETAKGGQMARFECALTIPAKAIDGREVNPGYRIFHNIVLTPTEKLTVSRIKESMAKFREAITGSTGGAFGPVEQYIGSKFIGIARPSKDENFGGSEFAAFVKPKL